MRNFSASSLVSLFRISSRHFSLQDGIIIERQRYHLTDSHVRLLNFNLLVTRESLLRNYHRADYFRFKKSNSNVQSKECSERLNWRFEHLNPSKFNTPDYYRSASFALTKFNSQLALFMRSSFINYQYSVTRSVHGFKTLGDYKHKITKVNLRNTLSTLMSGDPCNSNDNQEPREISFKTPYGQIAGLEWGFRDAPNKILCIHGWLDNAGSFERLVPSLLKHGENAKKYHVVAVDMPGVGLSSHRPPSSEYTTFSNIIEMRRVTQQLNWNQNVTLLAHSLGGHLSFIYSCIYPKQISSLISIDTTHPITHQAFNWHVSIGNSIEHYFKCEYYGQRDVNSDTVVQVYTEAEALKRLMDAHNSSLTYESAKVMFKRGATKHPNGSCIFNRDVRHRHLSSEFRPDDELMLKYLEISFKPKNLMIIRALRSPYHRPDEIRLRYYNLFEKNCKLFRDIMLDGTHHLHMNTPDKVAIEINKFLADVEQLEAKSQIDKPNL